MIKTSSQTILPVISPNRGSIMQNSGSKEKFRFPSMGNSFQMRTLDKYIRSNNVSDLLKDSRVTMTPMRDRGDVFIPFIEKYLTIIEKVVADEVKEAQLNVLNLRKKCNEVRESCVKKEQEITKLRSELDYMRTKEETISEGLLGAQSKLDRLNIALEHQNTKIEEAYMNKRVYSNMLDRTKHDKLADQMKEAYLENILHKEQRELNTETKQAVKAKQFEFQTRNMFEGVVKHLEHEDRKRQENLDVFEQTVIAQEEAETKRAERFERNQVLAENISNDLQDSNNTRWREVLLVHRFLNHFLRRKIEREIREYENVEKAYQKIKASTGLNDTREIVHRFVNREQTYSELLISIADYEKKIGVLKKHNEQLKSNIQSLKDQNGPSERYREDKGELRSDLPQAYKALSLTNSVCKEAKLRVEKTFTWTIQTLIKIDKAKNVVNNDYYKTYSKDNLSQAFLQVIDIVKSNLTDLNENNVEQVLDEIDKTKIDQEIGNETFVAKNVRVKQVDTTSERSKTAESNMPISKVNIDDRQYIASRADENALDELEILEVQRVQIKGAGTSKAKGGSRRNLDKKEK